MFFRYSKSKRSYEPIHYWTKNVTLPQKPLKIAFSDRVVNLAFSYQYSFINFDTKQAEKDYTSDCQIIKKPFVFSVKPNLFINAGP